MGIHRGMRSRDTPNCVWSKELFQLALHTSLFKDLFCSWLPSENKLLGRIGNSNTPVRY